MEERLDREEVRLRLVPLRLVVGAALAAQVVFALAATWLLASGFETSPELLLPLGGALALLGAGLVAAWPLVRSALVRDLGTEVPPGRARALEVFFRVRIVAAALAEGFGFFGIVVFLMTGARLALLAPALACFTLLRLQPDPSAFREFARTAGVADLGDLA